MAFHNLMDLILPADEPEDWRRANGGVIAAEDMFLSGGNITNTGTLLAQNGLSISADTFTNERRVADIGVLGGTMQHGIQDGGLVSSSCGATGVAGTLGLTSDKTNGSDNDKNK